MPPAAPEPALAAQALLLLTHGLPRAPSVAASGMGSRANASSHTPCHDMERMATLNITGVFSSQTMARTHEQWRSFTHGLCGQTQVTRGKRGKGPECSARWNNQYKACARRMAVE